MTITQLSANGQLRFAQRLSQFVQFAVNHSLRDMWRNRARTAFALVCVATGVAAVVALRTLAFMVGDELTTNLAQVNRGDIRVYASAGVPELVELSVGQPVFTQEAVGLIRAWSVAEDVDVMFARMSAITQIKKDVPDGAALSLPGFALFVEPENYPFYDEIHLNMPSHVSFADALSAVPGDGEAYPLIVSKTLTRSTRLGVAVGDVVQLGTAEARFVVTGIAPPDAESVLTVPQTAFLDYVYLPFDALPLVGEKALPDQVFVKAPAGTDIAALETSLVAYLQRETSASSDIDKELNRATVLELEAQNSEVADVIDDMILVMGLSSLLIGGIGIINTMLVVVSRRTLEIAVLKTLGLKAYRVTLLFLVEALLLGLIGSAIGLILGVTLSYVIRDVGETAFQIGLTWRIYPEALTSGLFLGVVMTGLFGFLPTLIAGQVRPAVVLRPNEAQMPAAGLLQILITLVIMITVLGLLVDTIVEGALEYGPVYMIAGGGALVGLFAGIIVANTRLGKPIPPYYQFRLARRFERLDGWIVGSVGAAVGWLPLSLWRSASRGDRGRAAITWVLRGLRQTVLLYGALAVGALLASGIMLVASELWLPFGVGSVKPANDIVAAYRTGDVAWLVAWLAITVLVGGLIRAYARALVGVIALSSLGVTLGGAAGVLGGRVLETALYGTRVWDVLAEMSTGVVLVEGALALLGAVYVGYWLLVWAFGKLPPVMLMGLVSVVTVSIGAGLAAAAMVAGKVVVAALVMAALTGWGLLRLQRDAPVRSGSVAVNGHAVASEIAQAAARGTAIVLLAVALLGGGFLAIDLAGMSLWAGVVLAVGVGGFWLWRAVQRRYAVDGRLILREMAGRRGRVASTLLGLSVGIAGLSLVSLTTGAVSNLLSVQLEQAAEGNLVVFGTRPEFGPQISAALEAQDTVEHYAQLTTYSGILLSINGEDVERFSPHEGDDAAFDERENSNYEQADRGIQMALSERNTIDALPDYEMREGRKLTAGDVGEHRVMLRESFFSERFDIHVGDRLMFLFENEPGETDDVLLQLRVIGIVARNSEQTGLEEVGNLFSVPPQTLSSAGITAQGVVAIVQVAEENGEAIDQVKAAVTEVPGVIAFELSVITQLLENLLEQLKAIPTLVAWLALLAGTAIIANTVALATQERRRQIGVMKAVGLKGRRVLLMLMIENGLVGLIAGLIGVVVGFATTVVLVLASENPDELKNTIEFSTMGWLILMSIGVAIGAAMLSAWSAAAEKPMNVLRYE